MRLSTNSLFGALLLTVVSAGCSGGNIHDMVPAGASVPVTSGPHGSETFSIRIPSGATTGAAKRPAYVSPATTQMTVDIQQGGVSIDGYPVTVGLTPTSTGCSSTLAGTFCQISFAVAPGSYTATVTLADAASTPLSQTQDLPFDVIAGQNNVIAMTVGGLATSLLVAPVTPHRLVGSTGALSIYGNRAVTFQALPLDADGNIIVGPGAPQADASLSDTTSLAIATPAPTSPTQWTLQPSYQATDPRVPYVTTLTVSATPVPQSGGSTVTASLPVSVYQPWIYVYDKTSASFFVYDEDGDDVTSRTAAFTGDAAGTSVQGIAYGNNQIYVLTGTGGGGNGAITAYGLLGGAAVANATSGTIATLGEPQYIGGLSFDEADQTLYLGDAGSASRLQGYNALLTANVADTTFYPSYGSVAIPQTRQVAFASAYGGVLICSEALSCTNVGSGLNSVGIGWDPYAGRLALSAPQCCGFNGGVYFSTLDGTQLGNVAQGPPISAIAFDPYAALWVLAQGQSCSPDACVPKLIDEAGNAVSMIGAFASYPTTDKIIGIAIVP